MDFRTPVKPLDMQGFLRHDMRLLTLGSCFSDAVGSRLADRLFRVSVNPFGPLFNPMSIASAIEMALVGRFIDKSELIENQGLWHSMHFHSRFSAEEPLEVVAAVNEALRRLAALLPTLDAAVITFGSSIGHRYRPSGLIAGNCHKLPASQFDVEELSVDEITNTWNPLVDRLLAVNSKLKFIFTVSPVRHLAYGAHADRLSKARLLLAVDRLVADHQDCAVYFPVYEVMNDDLRDYRFYAADMVHPTDQAADYILDLFLRSFLTDADRRAAADSLSLSRFLSHRPLSQSEAALSAHRANARRLAADLSAAHPYLQPLVSSLLYAHDLHNS